MKKLSFSIAVLAAVLCAQVAQAGFMFTKISEYSATDGAAATFGNGNLPGGQQIGPSATVAAFTPSIAAIDTGASPNDTTDVFLVLGVMATGNDAIWNLNISENGSYSIVGSNLVTSSLTVVPTVTFADGAATSIELPSMVANWSSSTPTPGGLWSLELDLDVVAAATGVAGITDPTSVTKMQLAIDNRLFAQALGADDSAFIDKKSFRVTAVPEPSSFLFLGLVLGSTAALKRRRDRVALEA